MKTCEEMASSLLRRKEQYEYEKRQKRKYLVRVLVPAGCVCLLMLGCFWGFGKELAQLAGDTVYPGLKDNFDVSKGEVPNNPQANNKIVINRIDAFPADKMNINLNLDDFVKMDKGEICAYYGINIFPEVPQDIPEWEDSLYGVFKRNGGTGETYWDQQVLNYSNGDFSRTVNLEIKKGALPVLDYGFGKSSEEKSCINNWEVAIGLSESGYYHAVFMYRDVGFCVNAQGLTQDEFVAVLASIIR